MARLKTLTKEEWQLKVASHSGATPRYVFEVINSKPEFQLKRVIRGWFSIGDGSEQLTTSGFLEDEKGEIIAGVDGIPIESKDSR